MTDDRYQEAQQPEGRHHGWYLTQKNLPTARLERAQRRLEERVVEHQDKIDHPERYIANWNALNEVVQRGILESWRREILNFTEQTHVLQGILQSRLE